MLSHTSIDIVKERACRFLSYQEHDQTTTNTTFSLLNNHHPRNSCALAIRRTCKGHRVSERCFQGIITTKQGSLGTATWGCRYTTFRYSSRRNGRESADARRHDYATETASDICAIMNNACCNSASSSCSNKRAADSREP
jgi:hypothetical protein